MISKCIPSLYMQAHHIHHCRVTWFEQILKFQFQEVTPLNWFSLSRHLKVTLSFLNANNNKTGASSAAACNKFWCSSTFEKVVGEMQWWIIILCFVSFTVPFYWICNLYFNHRVRCATYSYNNCVFVANRRTLRRTDSN